MAYEIRVDPPGVWGGRRLVTMAGEELGAARSRAEAVALIEDAIGSGRLGAVDWCGVDSDRWMPPGLNIVWSYSWHRARRVVVGAPMPHGGRVVELDGRRAVTVYERAEVAVVVREVTAPAIELRTDDDDPDPREWRPWGGPDVHVRVEWVGGGSDVW